MIHPPDSPVSHADRENARTSRFLSLAIDMSDKRCLVVGAGRVGTRKIQTLVQAGADVVVVAPEASEGVRRLAMVRRVDWQRRGYHGQDLDGLFLVVAATNDRPLNRAIGRDARRRGILSCVASSAADCDTVFPAVREAGLLSVAVHSHGRCCGRARQVCDAIAGWLSGTEQSPELSGDRKINCRFGHSDLRNCDSRRKRPSSKKTLAGCRKFLNRARRQGFAP